MTYLNKIYKDLNLYRICPPIYSIGSFGVSDHHENLQYHDKGSPSTLNLRVYSYAMLIIHVYMMYQLNQHTPII